MQKGLVTIIVPVYKTEAFLDRCVESLVNQTYHNLDILLIDDGSPDSCPMLCDKWAERDGRIRVIHKENEGLGVVRNTGIQNAYGEYFCFVDSDDYIAPDTIEKAYNCSQKENADIVVFGLTTVDKNGNVIKSFVPGVGERTYSGNAVCEEFLPEYIAPDPQGNGERLFYMSTCVMLFSLAVVKAAQWKVASEREIISEDVYSLLSLFKHIRSVAILPEAKYFYVTNEASLSRSYQPDRYLKIRHFFLECIKLCEKQRYSEKIMHRVTKPYLAFTIAALKQEIMADIPKCEKKRNIKKIIDDDILQQVLQNNRKDKVSVTRSVLFFCMRRKMYQICRLLLRIKA